MWSRRNWNRFSALLPGAILLVAPCWAQDSASPAVKKSEAGVCHERGSSFYDRTTHFKPFGSIEACLASGGRLPKKSLSNRPQAKILAAICDGYVPKPGDDDVLFGRVIKVTDGDTFEVKIQGAKLNFRMSDIDAPEMDQPYGVEARAALAAAIDNKDVVMFLVGADPYGREVVHVWIADLHINRELVDRGDAWFYSEYAMDDCLYSVENAARDAKRGLWALPLEDRVEPWYWREARHKHAKH